MKEQRILALVGSPRKVSTSESLARYLTEGLKAQGWQTSVLRVSPALRREDAWTELEEQFLRADVVALSFPLYVDALPSELTLTLERLAVARRATPAAHPQRVIAMVQCGFFEASQNDIALAICAQFAREVGMTWSGGLPIGAGGAIAGQPLARLGGMVRHITGALDMIIAALQTGEEIPPEAFTLVRKQMMPRWMYFAIANLGMYKGTMDHHVLRQINAQPYKRLT
jgi:hypothetical protein